MVLKLSLQVLEKYSNVKHHKIPSNRNRVVSCGQTNGHDRFLSKASPLCLNILLIKLYTKSKHNFINNLSSATCKPSSGWIHNCGTNYTLQGAGAGTVGWGTALQAGRWQVRFPIVSLEFFIKNPSDRTMALCLTQPLTETSTRNISWGIKVAGA